MALRINLGRRVRDEDIDLESLPTTVTRTAGRLHATFICAFALVWGGFPVAALLFVGGEINWDLIWIVALFPLIAIGLFLYGLRQLRWFKTITIGRDRVAVTERGLFRSTAWDEPLSAYQGVVARTKRVSRGSGNSSRTYTVYLVDLYHDDSSRTVTLFASTDDSEWRAAWEDAARRLSMKALEESGDGLIERNPEDLDKSVAALMQEGKVAVDHDALKQKAEGLAVDLEGEIIVATRKAPQNSLIAALIFLLFPLIFIWVGFYSDAPAPVSWIFGGVGILFEALIILGVIWDLLSRQRIRIGPQRIRVCAISRWGETKGKTMAVSDIEMVKLGRDDGKAGGDALLILGDEGKLRFGKRLPDETLAYLQNLVLAKIEKHHVTAAQT